MARPAGYSSDEDFSDDGLSFSHDEIKIKKQYRPQIDEEELICDKFVSAVIDGKIEEVKEFLDDSNINYKSKKHGCWTALMHACSQGNVEMVKLLLEAGANPEDHFQLMTPLHCVCDSNNADEMALLNCVNLLLEHNAPLNAKDWHNMGPLTHAVKKNREKLVLKLISLGCKVDSEDSDGWTPIFYAVDGGHTNLVQILKDAGASIKRIDHKGRTLYDIATAKFYKVIAEMVSTSEKFVEIEDVIERYTNYKRMSNYEYILSELPDKTKGRFHGFSSDAARWIHGIGLDTLVKLFMDKKIQLGEILTMDDQQLKEIGVEFSYDRTKIRYCVQNFHQHSWGKNCLRDVKGEIDLHIAAQVICNAIKQLHIVGAGFYFWKKNNGHELCQNKDCIKKGIYYVKYLRSEIDILLKIVHEIEEEDDIKPSDLIRPRVKEKNLSSWLSKKKIAITAVILMVVYKVGKGFYPSIRNLKLKFPYKF